MKRKSLGSWAASAAITLGLVGAAVASSAGIASAGTNGQQIRFYDSRHVVYSLYVVGHNHNGDLVEHCFSTPVTDNYLSGWWWKGETLVYVFTGAGNTPCRGDQSLVVRDIPAYQSGSDWYTLDDLHWWG